MRVVCCRMLPHSMLPHVVRLALIICCVAVWILLNVKWTGWCITNFWCRSDSRWHELDTVTLLVLLQRLVVLVMLMWNAFVEESSWRLCYWDNGSYFVCLCKFSTTIGRYVFVVFTAAIECDDFVRTCCCNLFLR